MKRLRTSFAAVALAAITLLGAMPAIGGAATSTSGNGVKVAPVRTDLVIQPGGSKTISMYVQNVTKSETTYTVVVNDFRASNDESGAPALLLNGEVNDQHGLKKYVSSVDAVTVPAGQQKEVKVTISIPKGTAGGGYYGAVRFIPNGSKKPGQNIALSGSVGSLVLVRVPGDVIEKLSLLSFDARTDGATRTVFTSSKNITAVVRFRNEGNVQTQPFGKVILQKGGKTIGQYEINNEDQPGNVLPDSVRKFSVKLKDVGSFGKYKLVGNFGYGADGQLLTAQTTFYVVPLPIIMLALVIIALIVFLIFGMPRLMRNYNKRVLRKAGRR